MEENDKFLIVKTKVLPEVYLKVVEAKKLMESGKVKHIQDAVNAVGISRSVFYKYKDSVFPYYKKEQGQTITFSMDLIDEPGLLSNILNIIAENGANILTINQTLPLNSVANVMITIEMKNYAESFFEKIKDLQGLQRFKILNVE